MRSHYPILIRKGISFISKRIYREEPKTSTSTNKNKHACEEMYDPIYTLFFGKPKA